MGHDTRKTAQGEISGNIQKDKIGKMNLKKQKGSERERHGKRKANKTKNVRKTFNYIRAVRLSIGINSAFNAT